MSDTSNKSTSSTKIGDRLPKLKDDGTSNNYGEWTIQAQADFESWDLWKHIDGPTSTPPIIPELCANITHERIESNGDTTLFPIPGNTAARQKILDEANPWLSQDKIARARIFCALSGEQLHLVSKTTYAKQAWCYEPDFVTRTL
jgi:hypothetical protein